MTILKKINKICDIGNGTFIEPLTEIVRGMSTVLTHSFREPITIEYPEVKPALPKRYKGRLALLTNPDGSDICIACKMCARACPCGDLIQIQTQKIQNEQGKTVNIAEKYTIDIGRCIFCGNCTEVCPVSCLVFVDNFELADYTREALVYDKEMLMLSPEESEKWKKDHPKE